MSQPEYVREHLTYQTKEQTDWLRLFAPYLPYQLDVWCPSHKRYGRLMGLPCVLEGQERTWAEVLLYPTRKTRQGRLLLDFAQEVCTVLPVLRGFSDLCTPLPDETVPAVQLITIGSPHLRDVAASYDGGDEIHFTAGGGHVGRLFRSDFEAGAVGYNQAQYLHRVHFAIGLRPDQYHPLPAPK